MSFQPPESDGRYIASAAWLRASCLPLENDVRVIGSRLHVCPVVPSPHRRPRHFSNGVKAAWKLCMLHMLPRHSYDCGIRLNEHQGAKGHLAQSDARGLHARSTIWQAASAPAILLAATHCSPLKGGILIMWRSFCIWRSFW